MNTEPTPMDQVLKRIDKSVAELVGGGANGAGATDKSGLDAIALLIYSGSDFASHCYQEFFLRQPTSDEAAVFGDAPLEHPLVRLLFLNHLRTLHSEIRINGLDELMASLLEPSLLGSPRTPGTFSYSHLLLLSDIEFVASLYQLVLHRLPDFAGFVALYQRLRHRQINRMQAYLELLNSFEARARPPLGTISGKVFRLWKIGNFFGAAYRLSVAKYFMSLGVKFLTEV